MIVGILYYRMQEWSLNIPGERFLPISTFCNFSSIFSTMTWRKFALKWQYKMSSLASVKDETSSKVDGDWEEWINLRQWICGATISVGPGDPAFVFERERRCIAPYMPPSFWQEWCSDGEFGRNKREDMLKDHIRKWAYWVYYWFWWRWSCRPPSKTIKTSFGRAFYYYETWVLCFNVYPHTNIRPKIVMILQIVMHFMSLWLSMFPSSANISWLWFDCLDHDEPIQYIKWPNELALNWKHFAS